MNNQVTILLQNYTGIAGKDLYVYITDGNNNFYQLSAANNWVATINSGGACSITYNSLPVDDNGHVYFYFDATTGITGGEIWFSNSASALSGGGGSAITQPPANSAFVFDHVEFAITPNSSINVDTTSVDQLGIPITLLINPGVSGGSSLLKLAKGQNFPAILGTQPGMGMKAIMNNFNAFMTDYPSLADFSSCASSFTYNEVYYSRLLAPVHLIANYAAGGSQPALATVMDTAIYSIFNYCQKGNQLVFQDPVSGNTYAGSLTTLADPNGSTYTVLQFTHAGDTHNYNIYYPFFNTNCAAAPNNNALINGGVLPPPPTCWGTVMPTTMPPTAMALACAGVFGDAGVQFPPLPPPGQPANTQQALLGNLENQLVSLLTRGLLPAAGSSQINNLLGFTMPAYSAAQLSPPDYNNLSDFTDPAPANNMPVTNNAFGIYTAPASLGNMGIDFYVNAISGSVTLGDGTVQTFSYTNGNVSISPYSGTSNSLTGLLRYNNAPNQLQFNFASAVTPMPVLQTLSYAYGNLLGNQYAAINGLTPFPTGLSGGMQLLSQNGQPATVYYTNAAAGLLVMEAANNQNLLAQGTEWALAGNFYPVQNGTPLGMWNAYSGFLHNGTGVADTVPFINGLGYGYAYDDQGGYSSDETVNFDANNSATIGILLNPVDGMVAG